MFEAFILPLLHCICCTTAEPVISPQTLLTQEIGKYFEWNDSDGNTKLETYFKENKKLINNPCLNIIKDQKIIACTPLEFSLSKQNYFMALVLIDNGAKLSISEEKNLLIHAIKMDTQFNNIYIKNILNKTDILETEYINDKNTTYTPLKYAQKHNNKKAVETITLALKNHVETIQVDKK